MEKAWKGLAALVGSVASTAGTAASAWIAYSHFVIDHDVPLEPALQAEREQFDGGFSGMLHYYRDRAAPGAPVLLLHSINAAASAYEMRPIFEHFRGQRPMYALELPGFGFSERSDRVYSPRVFTNAIIDFLETQLDEPADVVALSLSSEFAARAALERPGRVRSLTMISPTGLGPSRGDRPASGWFYSTLAFPLWARPFYDLVATERSIRYFLQQSFDGAPDEGLIDYSYATSHQPGAHYAPLYFVAGKLFSPGIRKAVYEKLNVPVMVIYDQDPFTSFEALPALLTQQPNWQAHRAIPTRGLPQFEQPEETFRLLQTFWEGGGTPF